MHKRSDAVARFAGGEAAGIAVALRDGVINLTGGTHMQLRRLGIMTATLALFAAAPAFAQETTAGPGRLEVTVIPAGGTFVMSKDANPDFGNYTYGGAVAYNFNPFIGVEGEVGGSAGIAQDLELPSGTSNLKTPNTLNYSGNVVFSAAGHSVVPFVTGGVGGLTMFQRESLGIDANETFLVGNVGGGVKWYAPNGRWGLRGDYRFIALQSKDDAPAFVGHDTRYGHRVYVGVIINAVR
jgi:hypothetical protein